MAYAIGKEACPKCRSNGRDKSGDNLVVYDDGGKVCFACSYVEYSDDFRKSYKQGLKNKSFDEREEIMDRTSNKIISKKENEELKSKTGFTDFRGVRQDTWKKLGVRFAFDQETGEPTRQYYPTTLDGKLAGYKRRDLPKDFGTSLGETGAVCDFFGAFLRKPSQKTLVIVGGEIDQASVYQVLDDYAARRDYDYANILVVSPTTGENCSRQVKNNHKWLSSFDEIKVGLDNDDAGKEALKKVLKALPNVKVSVIEWTKKDPNEMLQAGMEKDILNCIYNSRVNVSSGISGSTSLKAALTNEFSKVRLPLPPFMKKLQEMTRGGIPLNSIVNIGGLSGGGKTTIVNEMIYFWLFNSPYKIGILSLELNSGQYANALLSRHLGKKLDLIEDNKEKLSFLEKPEVSEKVDELFSEDGRDRFYLMSEREGDIREVKKLIEEMVISCGCQVIVLDPLTDILDGMSNEDQAVFLKWQKQIIEKYDAIFINITHLRKTNSHPAPEDTGMDMLYNITEEDFMGTSSIYKSGGVNILFARNKRHPDDIERNRTHTMLDKCRHTGITGYAGAWQYDNNTHTMKACEVGAYD